MKFPTLGAFEQYTKQLVESQSTADTEAELGQKVMIGNLWYDIAWERDENQRLSVVCRPSDEIFDDTKSEVMVLAELSPVQNATAVEAAAVEAAVGRDVVDLSRLSKGVSEILNAMKGLSKSAQSLLLQKGPDAAIDFDAIQDSDAGADILPGDKSITINIMGVEAEITPDVLKATKTDFGGMAAYSEYAQAVLTSGSFTQGQKMFMIKGIVAVEGKCFFVSWVQNECLLMPKVTLAQMNASSETARQMEAVLRKALFAQWPGKQ